MTKGDQGVRLVSQRRLAVRVMLLCLSAAVMAGLCGGATAAPNDGDASRQSDGHANVNCGDLMTGGEQKICAEAQYRKAVIGLETAYAQALERASKGERNRAASIAASQRAWEVYRDAECKGVVDSGEGSGRMVWLWGCLAEKTNARIIELNVPFDQR
jgi:uncharacterized protein YecT (DUF1311 family)